MSALGTFGGLSRGLYGKVSWFVKLEERSITRIMSSGTVSVVYLVGKRSHTHSLLILSEGLGIKCCVAIWNVLLEISTIRFRSLLCSPYFHHQRRFSHQRTHLGT